MPRHTRVHIYMDSHPCQRAHAGCASLVRQHGQHPFYISYNVVTILKKILNLLCIKQDRHINYHLLVGLTSPLFYPQLGLGNPHTCSFLGHTFQVSELQNFGASSPLLGNFSTFSRFLKKLIPVVPHLVPLILLGINYSGLLV